MAFYGQADNLRSRWLVSPSQLHKRIVPYQTQADGRHGAAIWISAFWDNRTALTLAVISDGDTLSVPTVDQSGASIQDVGPVPTIAATSTANVPTVAPGPVALTLPTKTNTSTLYEASRVRNRGVGFVGIGARAESATEGATLTGAFPAGYSATAGDAAYLICTGMHLPSGPAAITPPSGYTEIITQNNPTGVTELQVTVFRKILTGSESAPSVTVPLDWSGIFACLGVRTMIFRAPNGIAEDATPVGTQNNGSTSFTPTGITTVTSDARVVVVTVIQEDFTDATMTTAEGFTLREHTTSLTGNDHTTIIADVSKVSAGAQTAPTFGISTAKEWAGAVFAIRAAGIDNPTIASTSTVNVPTLSPGAVTLTMPTITSASTLAEPTVTQVINLTLPHIASTSTLAAPTVTTGAVTLTMPVITDADTLNVPSVAQTLVLPTVTTSSQTFAPTVIGEALLVLPTIASTTTLAAPTVAVGQITLTLPTITSTATVHAPTVTAGAVSLSLPHISDGDTLSAPSLTTAVSVLLPTISDGDTLNSPSLTLGPAQLTLPAISDTDSLYAPTITTGAVSVILPLISDSDTLSTPTVSVSQPLSLPTIASTSALYAPTVVLASNVALPYIASLSTLAPPTVDVGDVTLTMSTILANNQLHPPVVDEGGVSLSLPTISDGDTLHAPTVDQITHLGLPHIASTATVHVLVVAGESAVTVPVIVGVNTLHRPTISHPAATITLPVIASTSTLFGSELEEETKVRHLTLVGTVKTVLISDVSRVTIENRSVDDVWCNAGWADDPHDPDVSGTDTLCIPPGQRRIVFKSPQVRDSVITKMLGTGTATIEGDDWEGPDGDWG